MLIAIDHGNYAIKTPHHSFVSGLSEHTVKPPMADEILEYDGRYWTTSGKRLSYMRDKTQDERYFILTLFAIAKELEDTGRYSPVEQIQLAVGLPPEHYGVLKDKFARYFKRDGIIKFVYKDKPYSIMIDKVKHHLLVDQETAPVVVRIFEECIAGRTASQIARALNDDGIPSPASYKEKNGGFYNGRILEEKPIWVACTVLRIIKDERYTGKMISNKRETVGISTGKMRALPQSEWIIVEDTHEAIIPQNMFSEAAASRRSRIKTVNQNTAGERADNLFVCGYCGRKLQKSNGKVTHLFCLKAGVSSNADCTRLHEPIETLQSSVLEVVKVLAKTLAEKAVQVKVNANREEPLLEKKAAMLKRTLQRAQNSKLDLYEEYRNGRMTRDKFITAQEERQTAIDSMRDELAATEATITKLRVGKEKAAVLEADAKGIQLLNGYRPKELRKLIEKVRVYENGRIEIDFRCHDDFTEEIIKAVARQAG